MKHRLAPILASLTTVALLVPRPAHAARPTVAECLAASDASLQAGNEHRLRAERSELLVCAAASCPADIRKECAHRVEEVNGKLPTVIFEARDAAGNDRSAVRVTLDGELLTERLEGTAVSIDPGEHTFLFEAAGETAVTKKLVVRQGQKDRREAVVFLASAPASVAIAPAATKAISPPPAPPSRSEPSSSPSPRSSPPYAGDAGEGLGGQKVLALVAGGLGVAGLGIGAAFGVMALSKKNEAQSLCPAQCSTQEGVNQWSDAGFTGNVATVALIVGGVGLAGAGVLWWSAPGSSRGPSTRVGLGPGGLQVRGVW